MDRRKFPGNGILILASIVVAVFLVMFLQWNRREEQRSIQQLAEEKASEAVNVQKESETDSGETQSQEEETSEEIQQNMEDSNSTSGDEEEEQQKNDDLKKENQVDGISFRGDSFIREENIPDKGFGVYLQNLLEQNGINLPVNDYTLYEAGTLSQMSLAGIDQSKLDAYIETHKANLSEDQLRITEVKVRDLSQYNLERNDLNYIPVICMGYNGGWGYDVDELCEQQQKILDTYQQKDKYLILGVYPTRCPDKAAYKEKMEQTWGEHYIMMDDVKENALSTDEGKEETAQIIYDKMMELGYLDGLQVEE